MTLVNAQERFTERMRLHMTATGRRVAELDVPELLAGTGARFVHGLGGVESAAEIAERHPGMNVVLLGRAEPGAAVGPMARTDLRGALDRLGVPRGCPARWG
ncbi:hypothetical protein [Streptomyces sp. MI02-7b]|uniref:hypothetical protein n=1 Tax=Streptomyces sp. MI02-7b TaxID=462941 RepID=UPI0029A67676|nr:hypothetical protein [Streptomyces sp. MI02-7b]MDX3077620.1 hypothetical protein [Streptomyces sp. MI02-7b]